MTDKRALRDAFVALIESELAVITAAAHSSREEATNVENRQEGQYDMRAQSAAYLAAGQAKLASELNDAATAYRGLALADPPAATASLGSVVAVALRGTAAWYFLGPAFGGREVAWEGETVTVITPASPLGRLLLGKKAGDSLPTGATVRDVR